MTEFDGRKVVVTGKIPGETRQSVEAKLRAAGALVQKAVTGDTDVLVTGEAVGRTKVNAAAKKGATVLAWVDAKRLLAGEQVEGTKAVPVVPAASSPRAGAFRPMLAKACEDGVPAGDGWLFEIKWDGYRCIATIAGGEVTFTSRSGLSTFEFPQIEKALAGLPDCTLDGEVVVLDGQGHSDFGEIGNRHAGAVFMAFDVVEIGGDQGGSVRHLVIETRKQLLRELLEKADGMWVSESPVFDDGEALLEHARTNGLEGIVAKRKGSTYQDGKRGPAWLKLKLRQEQEFVVVGWTPGKGNREGMVGGLVLAVNTDAGLVYAGRCGSGEGIEELTELRTIVRDTSPLIETPREEQLHATWVEPVLVVQVEFQRWTADGRLWHPSYKGRRVDKQAGDVHREPCLA